MYLIGDKAFQEELEGLGIEVERGEESRMGLAEFESMVEEADQVAREGRSPSAVVLLENEYMGLY